MADECPTGNDRYLTEMDIRIWLRDLDPEANTLLDDFEFGSEEIRTAMTLAVDKWNDTPPFIYFYDIRTFPFRSALLTATCANLLFIAAHRYRRNDLQYSIPGGAVNDQARHKEYDVAGERLWQKYMEWVAHAKRSLNIESGFGILDGGMRWVDRWHGRS